MLAALSSFKPPPLALEILGNNTSLLLLWLLALSLVLLLKMPSQLSVFCIPLRNQTLAPCLSASVSWHVGLTKYGSTISPWKQPVGLPPFFLCISLCYIWLQVTSSSVHASLWLFCLCFCPVLLLSVVVCLTCFSQASLFDAPCERFQVLNPFELASPPFTPVLRHR
jgi:hypothetical protein